MGAEETGLTSAYGITMSLVQVDLRKRCSNNGDFEDDWSTFGEQVFEVQLQRGVFGDARFRGFSQPTPRVYITATIESDVATIRVQRNP